MNQSGHQHLSQLLISRVALKGDVDVQERFSDLNRCLCSPALSDCALPVDVVLLNDSWINRCQP